MGIIDDMEIPTDELTGTSGPSPLQIRLLGGVEAVGHDGDAIDVGPAKCQLVLAALALSPGAAVPVGRLVELVWGDDPPRTAEKTLQSYTTQLRKALGPDRVVRTGSAYRLDVDADAVDVSRFDRLLTDGDTAGALAQWSGRPLAGLDPVGLAGPVAGLTERWLGAVEADLALAIERDPAAAVGHLTELTTDHPYREGLMALLMTALYASGRQAEALAAYRQARSRLIDELGVEPGPHLQQLEASILGHDDDLRTRSGPDTDTATGPAPSQDRAPIPTGTVTFAFSDVEGSTRLWAADRELTARAIARHEDIVRAATAETGGHVFATGGDSFGVAFNRADDGVRWAIEVQAAAAAEQWPDGATIRIRIGLHTGDAEERDENYYGPAVNLAARVADAGHGNQILLSTVTAALLTDNGLRSELQDLGPIRLDGIAAEQTLFQLGTTNHPPLRVQGGRDGKLPKALGPLFGRAELLDATVRAMADTPVVTLVGPGGIGKTRLSLAAAELAAAEQGTGAWLVELAEVTASDDVTRAVADALDIKDVGNRTLLDTVVAAVGDRRSILVLDNCEHVVDGAAELAEAVSEAAADVRILVTSREGLGVAGEQLLVVGPLDAEGAGVELFNRRATAVDRGFDPEANRETVAEICRRLDGVPLAIELAAARVRTLPPDDLVRRLDDRFRVLSAGRRRSVERHRTLRATIQWSHDLLTEGEQILFRRLSVFAGSFDLAIAERVVADPASPDPASADGALDDDRAGAWLDEAEVGTLLDDLVERSMVLVESGRSGRRFRLLETMRQFGAEQLAELDEPHRVADRHADAVAAEVEVIAGLLAGWREVEGAGRLSDLWPNLRAAVEHAEADGDVELAVRLIGPIADQAITRRGVTELAGWSERILAMADPDDDETIAKALLWTSFHYSTIHDPTSFRALIDRHGLPDHVLARTASAIVDDSSSVPQVSSAAIAEMERQGDRHLANLFGIFLAGTLLGNGKLDEAEGTIAELAERFRGDGPPTFLNWILYLHGAAAEFRGDDERAQLLYDEALRVDVPPTTNSPNDVLRARTLFRRGQTRQAFIVLREYASDLLEMGNLSGSAIVAIEFINMMVDDQRLDLAAIMLGYLDETGLLEVEGPAFRTLVDEASKTVDADPDALARRRQASGDKVDDRQALSIIRGFLDELIAADG